MTIRLLLSPIARDRLAERIQALAKQHGAGIEFVDPISRQVDVAFISRDITGRSTKHEVLPETQRYFDALLHSPTITWVHIHSAGIDRPVYLKLLERGVSVTPSTGVNSKEVAQSVLGGVLSLARKFPQLAKAQKSHVWAPTLGADLPRQVFGQTVVIVGWGAIGQQIAQYLSMLDMNIIVVRHDASRKAGTYETIEYQNINKILPRADWLVLCCPLTDQTRYLIGAEQLRLMPVHSHIVNVSRGDTINELELEIALLEKRIAGAFLDVFSHEPLNPSSRLWDMENVIVTPHSAGFSDGNEARVDELFCQLLETQLQQKAG
jgi:D-2-hydroxyacid dehydrogenase (NADP+)